VDLVEEIKRIDEEYRKQTDPNIWENANTYYSYSWWISYFVDRMINRPEVLSEYLPKRAVARHYRGDIHIHKLPLSLWIGYCCGWSLENLLIKGLRAPFLTAVPPRHIDTALAQLNQFILMSSQEWSGAQAVNIFDHYIGVYVVEEKVPYKKLVQEIQRFVFNTNYPLRVGYQSPFVNITLGIGQIMKDIPLVFRGEYVDDTVESYMDGVIAVNKAIIDTFMKGDRYGRSFSFPIMTIPISEGFDWNGRRWGDLTDRIFELTARRGSYYFLNGYSVDVNSLMAMCCRLTIDMEAVRGIWAIPPSTGSINYISINLPRLALLDREGKQDFEEGLLDAMESARECLNAQRRRVEESFKQGLMPLSREYLPSLEHHYNTIAVIGLPEMGAILRGVPLEPTYMSEIVEEERKVLEFMLGVLDEFSEEDGVAYNLEEAPAESTAHKFAKADLRMFGEREWIPVFDGEPMYSNSIVPYYVEMSLWERVMLEARVQKLFTGGVMLHIFLRECVEPEVIKKLIYRICTNTDIVYFSITPSLVVCKKCGTTEPGLYEKCPVCGSETEIWSRIVGYYRPVRNWHPARRKEFWHRQHYSG